MFVSKLTQKFYDINTRYKIVWHNVIMFVFLHAAALYGFYLKFFTPLLLTKIFFVLYSYLSAWGVTAGRHRYFSHRSFKGSKVLDLLLVFMACTTFEQSIYVWCRDHRLHHKYSETDADPYNSKRGFFFCHMGWFFVRKHPDVKEKGKTIDMSDLEANPIIMFEHKYCLQLAFIFTLLLPIIIPWYFWNESLQVAIFYCTLYRFTLALHATWTVNSFAHIYGMKPYDKEINPTENDLVSTLSLGEGFHNYHHTFPWDYKAAELGGDFRNITTFFIDFLAYIGLVTERKTASGSLIEKRKLRTGSKDTNIWHSVKNNFKSVLYHLLYIAIMV